MGGEKNHVVREDAGPDDGSELELSASLDGATLALWEAYDPDAGLSDDASAEDQVPGQRLALLLRRIARTAEQWLLLAVAVADGGWVLLGDACHGGHGRSGGSAKDTKTLQTAARRTRAIIIRIGSQLQRRGGDHAGRDVLTTCMLGSKLLGAPATHSAV